MNELPPPSALLLQLLHSVHRRYRLPGLQELAPTISTPDPATLLALSVEQVRAALVGNNKPEAALEKQFLHALAQLIRDALDPINGDPVFQAMVLRQHVAAVRNFTELNAQAESDRRWLQARINALAHPEKLRRHFTAAERALLEPLQQHAATSRWPELTHAVQQALQSPAIRRHEKAATLLRQILASSALQHLLRLDELEAHPQVQQFQLLWQHAGPRAGSAAASQDASNGQQRGAATEAATARALTLLAEVLNQHENEDWRYRLVTSLRVPASLPASHDRAKTEWDAVLLRQAVRTGADPAWEICLLVEAKAAPDAPTNDLPRLMHGLRLLAHADPASRYRFKSREGAIVLQGASLAALGRFSLDPASRLDNLAQLVLYCCDSETPGPPRLLNAASRTQLLSAPASLDFAHQIELGQQPEASTLQAVWHDLLTAPQYRPLLEQTWRLKLVRELMVHVDDLHMAIEKLSKKNLEPIRTPGKVRNHLKRES